MSMENLLAPIRTALYAMTKHGETWKDVEASVIEERPTYDDTSHHPSFDNKFDTGYGGKEGDHFTVWTKKRVYFPVIYDGAESVGSVSRNPDNKATEHFGGY